MADLLQKGVTWLDVQRNSHKTQSITYARGPDSVTINATIGSTEFEEVDEDQIVHQIESRDFIVRPADLVLDSITVTPETGDRILETRGGIKRTYEILAPGGEQPWRYSDRYQTMIRIHTKLVDTEDLS